MNSFCARSVTLAVCSLVFGIHGAESPVEVAARTVQADDMLRHVKVLASDEFEGRAPGSLGASSDPSRVFPGMRMAGRTGGDRTTIQNLQVVKVLAEENLILIKGAVPGHNGATVLIVK